MTRPRLPRINPPLSAARASGIDMFQNEAGVGAAEAEGIRQDGTQSHAVAALAHNVHIRESRIELLDIRAFAKEAVLHHQQRVDCFLHPGGAEGMAGQGFCRGDRRTLSGRSENGSYRLDLLHIANFRRSRMGIDVIDRSSHIFERHAHAPYRSFAGRRDHVMAVRGQTISGDLGVNLRAARLGTLQLLQHQYPSAAGDDETVPVLIIGAGGARGTVVESRGHRGHRIEQNREGPIELFAAAREYHVLLAVLDHLIGIADAVVGSRAGRRDRVIDALDFEPGGKRRRGGRGHRLWHRKRPDLFRSLGARDIRGLDESPRRRPARTHDDAGALMRYFMRRKARIQDRLIHRDMVPGGAAGMETHRAAIDDAAGVERRRAVNLAAKAELGVFLRLDDAGLGLPQGGKHFLAVVPDRGHNPHSGDDDASHASKLLLDIAAPEHESGGHCSRAKDDRPKVQATDGVAALNKPTLMSLASYMRVPSASSQPSAMPSTSLVLNTRFNSTP